MVNQSYEPNEREAIIIELFKEGRKSDKPWGRANPQFFREETNLKKGQVEYALRNLTNAGWIRRLNKGGLYEFVDDPRED
ncbi:MarR family transcriptional regulator [Natrinema versiforme]|uniref:MarR family transcriptional regulator n=1 Tax=Natrinema versiforme TaxID=88724 RepID=UPI000A026C31|nr:MarR family transcriptional regulator [Natrinema versiforme]